MLILYVYIFFALVSSSYLCLVILSFPHHQLREHFSRLLKTPCAHHTGWLPRILLRIWAIIYLTLPRTPLRLSPFLNSFLYSTVSNIVVATSLLVVVPSPSHGCPLRCPCQRGPVPFLGHFLMELWVVQMPQPLWRERPCLPLSVLRHRLSAQRLHLSCHLRLSSLAPFSHPSQVLARLDWPLRPRPAPCLGPWLTQLCLPGLPNLGRTLRSWTLD